MKSGTSAALLTLSSGTLLNLTLSGGTASPAGNDPLCIVQGGTLAVAGGLITGGAASGSYHGVHVNSGLFTSSGTVQAGTGSTNAYGLYQTGGSTNIAYMNGWKSPNYISGGTTTIGTIAGGVGSGGYGLELSGSAVINATNVGGGRHPPPLGIYVVSGGTINATNVWGGSGLGASPSPEALPSSTLPTPGRAGGNDGILDGGSGTSNVLNATGGSTANLGYGYEGNSGSQLAIIGTATGGLGSGGVGISGGTTIIGVANAGPWNYGAIFYENTGGYWKLTQNNVSSGSAGAVSGGTVGGAAGSATAGDVWSGVTFSSTAAPTGGTGSLSVAPSSLSYGTLVHGVTGARRSPSPSWPRIARKRPIGACGCGSA